MHDARAAVKPRSLIAVPNVSNAVAHALATASECVPMHAVMLSMATTHHRRLRDVQFARVAHLQCFMVRLVSVCYGFIDAFGQCVYGDCNKTLGLANPCLPSDYRRSQYVALNWAKWPLFIDALRVARSALWLEADVVILSNPWELLLAEAELAATVTHAVRYQWEAPPCSVPELVASPAVSCSKRGWPAPHPEPLNCGQLLLNSLDFALEVWGSRPAVFRNGAMSQQGYANAIKGNYSHSGLPLAFYNYCWKAHKYTYVVETCKLVTWHATCEMVAKSKRLAMNTSVSVSRRRGCATSVAHQLTAAQLGVFSHRPQQPKRLRSVSIGGP